MCLAIPVKVVEVGAADTAIVELGGVRMEISLALLADVQVGRSCSARVSAAGANATR